MEGREGGQGERRLEGSRERDERGEKGVCGWEERRKKERRAEGVWISIEERKKK